MTRDEYLKHHGILGQKWGHKAGPPYPLSPSDHTAAEKKAGYQKSIKDMSDEELNNSIRRLEQERRYKELTKVPTPEHKKKGKEVVSHILTNSLKSAGTTLMTAAVVYAGKKTVEAVLGQEAKASMFNEQKKVKTTVTDVFQETLADGTKRTRTTVRN